MIILAIDPGVSGAIAGYNTLVRDRIAVYDMPVLDGDVNPHILMRIFEDFLPDLAIIEQVAPMPKEGVRSVWRFAAAFTTACVAVKLANIPLIMAPSARWKRTMNLKGGKEGKEQARERAIDAFPNRCRQLFAQETPRSRRSCAARRVRIAAQ